VNSSDFPLVARINRESTVVTVGHLQIGDGSFTVIAGPCSVEDRTQIFACAEQTRLSGANILRGGCFKPRTSPYAFQGLGVEGLALLQEAGSAFCLPVVTEVPSHDTVELVASYSDILQVGARNMQNYPLLKAVGKATKPVLLKRGPAATIDELLLAAEYILSNGNNRVILCERGIRTFEPETRFTLDIAAVPVLKQRTHLPVLVDPSHAAGKREYVTALALAAKAVGADGVMVELHPDPDQALSDGPQSLTFDQFDLLMSRLGRLSL